METKYRVYNPDGATTDHVVDLPAVPQWNDLAPLLRQHLGQHNEPEHVNVYWQDEYKDMFVDEMGHAKGLMENLAATQIYYNNMIAHDLAAFERMAIMAGGLVPIVGVAILFDRKVWF